MQFGDRPLAACTGALLAHSRTIGGRRLAKGHRLTEADIADAAAAGLDYLTVAVLDPGDVGEAEAAAAIGKALAGSGVAALPPVHGRVNLAADSAGLLQFDAQALFALNRIDQSLTVGTTLPATRVAAGEIVATIKVIPYAVLGAVLSAALDAATKALLSVSSFRPRRAYLIQTRLPDQTDKLLAKTMTVTQARLTMLGGTISGRCTCGHDAAEIAAAIRGADSDLVLIAGAAATVDSDDIVPAAIRLAGGEVVRVGMPVDPGNLLVLGEIGHRPVLGLPGCARSPKRNGVDLVLERLFAGLPVTSDDIAAMGVGGLLADLGERPEPRSRSRAQTGPIGAILLAAGKSTRMGGANKLVADLEGRPLVAHAARAITDAKLPLIVVTGNSPEAVEHALAATDAAFVHAPDFAEGLSRSLRAGALTVPPDWRAALVCLGDMPRITPAILRALTAALKSDDGIVVPTSSGKRGNPVLWGRAHIARLAALEGDVGGKALLGELADHVIEVEVDGDAIFADVDTPADLKAIGG